MSFSVSVCLSVRWSVGLCLCLSVSYLVCLFSACRISVSLSLSVTVSLSQSLTLCLSQSVSLSVCLSVCLSVSLCIPRPFVFLSIISTCLCFIVFFFFLCWPVCVSALSLFVIPLSLSSDSCCLPDLSLLFLCVSVSQSLSFPSLFSCLSLGQSAYTCPSLRVRVALI